MRHHLRNLSLGLAAVQMITGCVVGPDYGVPSTKLEASFKNSGFTEPPPPGSWWSMFNDRQLTRLIHDADKANPTVRAALARYDQARAALGLARADSYPAVTGEAYATRQTDSGNSNFSSGTYNDYRAALNLAWEIDLWGRVRRQIGVAAAEEQAAGYEFQAALLSLRAEVTRAYVSLRFADAEIALLSSTEALRAEARRLMGTRFEAGASSRIDLERAITEHERVKSELAQLRARRGTFENALAALTGRSAAGFRIAPETSLPAIPGAPAALPSDLLRRRPDVAAAERRLAAASDRIGLAVASYLPRVTLTGSGGFSSLTASDLFNSSSKLWSLGPEIDVPLFQGGRAFADKDRAIAAYHEALENYREELLQAVRETEDSLGDIRHLANAADSQKRGAEAAGNAAELTRERYQGGVTDYFEVVDADRTALAENREALAIDLNRALASARLIQALGGGWER